MAYLCGLIVVCLKKRQTKGKQRAKEKKKQRRKEKKEAKKRKEENKNKRKYIIIYRGIKICAMFRVSLLRHSVLENICSVCNITQVVLFINSKNGVKVKTAPTIVKACNNSVKVYNDSVKGSSQRFKLTL
jgi:hypothetical protein